MASISPLDTGIPSQADFDNQVYQAIPISRTSFQATVGVVFGVTIISIVARTALRIYSRRALFWDDYILGIGVVCLSAATGLVFKGCDSIFIVNALAHNPSLLLENTSISLVDLVNATEPFLAAFFVLVWTTTFTVKFSFLIFFKHLIERLGKINTYFWIVVVISCLSWTFLVGQFFISCPYFGIQSVRCSDTSRNSLVTSMTGLATSLDIITDIMIASFPLLVLRKSRIQLNQKLALGFFMCLSLVMVIFASIRVFWQYMEGSVAVMMASVTTFRTIFVNGGKRERRKKWEPSNSWLERVKQRRSRSNAQDGQDIALPTLPEATLKGLRTFIHGHHCLNEASTSLHTGAAHLPETENVEESLEGQIQVERGWRVDYSHAQGSTAPECNVAYTDSMQQLTGGFKRKLSSDCTLVSGQATQRTDFV